MTCLSTFTCTHSEKFFVGMDDLGPDQIQVLPDNDPTPTSPTRTTNQSRYLQSRLSPPKKSTPMNKESDFDKEMEVSQESLLSDTPVEYGYLKHIQTYKGLCNPNDKSLKKKVREFYKNQLDFIGSLEAILVPNTNDENLATSRLKRQDRIIAILTTAALIINIVLVIIKIIAAVVSKSLSVISSVVDGALDLLSSIIFLWTARKVKKRNLYKYPTGRARLEPTAILILSVVMCVVSAQVILESIQTLSQDIEYFTKSHNDSSCIKLPDLDMSTLPIIVMIFTIVCKAILFMLCYRINNPTMSALAEDNRNDVASNIVALVCGLIGSNALHKKIKQEAIVVDPIGALLISVYIITAWTRQAYKQVRHLTGITAEPSFLQRITHLVYNFRPDVVTKIDTVQAFHCGTKFFVEVDIGLPEAKVIDTILVAKSVVMKIYIRTHTGRGRLLEFYVEPTTTVKQLKQLTCEKTNDDEDALRILQQIRLAICLVKEYQFREITRIEQVITYQKCMIE
ncbi:unnamed protein product [Rotaria sordida]|uniref:Cation efflux protein transmembrane domain-containing protein n=1 Tax=Rotaria sordida TaxID=392033 RepID=A0A813VSK5_9BILA|nr:unnamed protein product [Rotaria sordida]